MQYNEKAIEKLINEINLGELDCPNQYGLKENCGPSCKECWRQALQTEPKED
jgi:hypothetical protein